LIVSDDYAPQLSPLRGAELELLHWVLLQTRGVGFYNSNLMAGASQAHKHTQFIPGDAIWSLRNPDAPHVRVN
jgi:ATP adenylyltransferase